MQSSDAEAERDLVEILLLNPGDHPDLAVDYLSNKLWLSRSAAQHLVRVGYGIIDHKFRPKVAAAEIALMAAMGIEARIAQAGDRKSGGIFDVSIRRTSASSIARIKQELKSLGLFRKLMARDFLSPVGLEICDLPHKRALMLARRLRRIEGVKVTLCSQEGALFDVMSPPHITTAQEAVIHEFASSLGCEAVHGHGMLATGMRRDQFAQLAARFPKFELACANRAFERIDLYATGMGTISVEDLIRFTARYGRAATKAISAGERYRIETNLSRPEARLVFEWLIAVGLEFRAEWFRG